VASERLLAVAQQAEKEHRQHKAHHDQATALTSVLPAIVTEEDRGPRKVALSPRGDFVPPGKHS
jgi:hypothetical protein